MEGNEAPELARAGYLDGDGNVSAPGSPPRIFQGSGNGHGTEDMTAGEKMIRRMRIERPREVINGCFCDFREMGERQLVVQQSLAVALQGLMVTCSRMEM